ncbi:unnamed protein product [Echinostoma caproni]|uniref:Peroxiredoxin-like 2 activated in M-CSF stimulated monocytes n=1 Tax=Echinostoma caproni TaxID=27848 RepID=A0A183AGI7_9TREM|nr:unnamed protein product [Echinostoma caproni]
MDERKEEAAAKLKKAIQRNVIGKLEAQKISQLLPAMQAKQIGLIGIGFDPDGVDEFVTGEFFKGDIYLDPEREVYHNLGLHRASKTKGIGSLFSSKFRHLAKETKQNNTGGNFKGDAWQNGGVFIVAKGGQLVFEHRQHVPTDQVDMNELARVLGVGIP